jgi:hypothetical protein
MFFSSFRWAWKLKKLPLDAKTLFAKVKPGLD